MGVAALFFGVAEKFRDVLNKAGNPLTSSWLLNATCIGGSVFFARLIIYLNKQFMFAPSNNTNKQHQRHTRMKKQTPNSGMVTISLGLDHARRLRALAAGCNMTATALVRAWIDAEKKPKTRNK